MDPFTQLSLSQHMEHVVERNTEPHPLKQENKSPIPSYEEQCGTREIKVRVAVSRESGAARERTSQRAALENFPALA